MNIFGAFNVSLVDYHAVEPYIIQNIRNCEYITSYFSEGSHPGRK